MRQVLLLIFFLVLERKGFIFAHKTHLYWRDYYGTIPYDAVPTGHGTFIGQITLKNKGVVPGTLYPQKGLVVSEGISGKVEARSNIKVLCYSNLRSLKWMYVNVKQLNRNILANAVLGGFEVGFPVYIGKVFHEGEWKIGKVFPPTSSLKGLRVWFNNGRTYVTEDFLILLAF